MKSLFLLLVLLGALASPVTAKTLSRIAAVVNDQIITTYQLEKTLSQALAQNPNSNQMTAGQFDQLRSQVLEKLINDKLLEQRIKELGLEVTDPELTAAIEDVQHKNNLSSEALEQALAAQGMSMARYREQLKTEILRYKLLGREVNYKIMVTNNEVRQYFRDHIDEYRVSPKISLNQLSFPLPADAQQREELIGHIAEIRSRLQNGEDFATVLADQQGSASGSNMGELIETDLAQPLQDALIGLDPGDVSEPVEMNDQLHIFQVTARNPGDIHLFDRVKGEIEDKLRRQKTDRRYEEWEQELRSNARVDIRI